MKKVLVVLSLFISFIFVGGIRSVKASDDYPYREEALGKQKLNYEDIEITIFNGKYPQIKMTAWYKIPANEVFVMYVSYEAIGKVSGSYPIRTLFKDSQNSSEEEVILSAERGGWAYHIVIYNEEEYDRYFRIDAFDFTSSLLLDCNPEGHFMLQSEYDRDSMTFTGYYDYVGADSLYQQANKPLSYVTYQGRVIDEDTIKSLFKGSDNTVNGIKEIKVTNSTYKDEVGDYTASVNIEDNSGNVSVYDLNIKVVKAISPEINGPDEVVVYMSEISNFNLESLYSNFKGLYGMQTYTLGMNAENQQLFIQALGRPSSTTLTITATFSGGKKAFKTFTLKVVDDISPEVYVSQLLLETSVLNSMSEDAIMDYIEDKLISQLSSTPTNLKILENNYSDFENEEGTYLIYFSYEVNGEVQESSLAITVSGENSNSSSISHPNLNGLYIGLGIVGVSIGFIVLTVIKQHKKKKIKQ